MMATDDKKPKSWLSTNFYLNVLKYIIYYVLEVSFYIAAHVMLQCSTLFRCVYEKLKAAGNTIDFAESSVKKKCEDYSSLDCVMVTDKNKDKIEINKLVNSPVNNDSCIKSISETDKNIFESISNQATRKEQIQTDTKSNSETRNERIQNSRKANPDIKEKEIQTNNISYSVATKDRNETKNATAKVNGVTEVTGKRLFTKRTAINSINKTVYEIDDSSKKKVDFKPKSVKDNWNTQNNRELVEYHDSYENRNQVLLNNKLWNLINDDLFNLSSKYSIAHCISEDLKMFNGISSVFKSKFGNIGVLMDKNLEVGHVGEIVCDTQYIFYLVVKKTESNTVSLHNFEKTLCNLVVRMKELGLKKLAIPKSEFDFYSSQKVKGLISKIFDKSDIEVSICTVTPNIPLEYSTPVSKVKSTHKNLWEMEPQTDRIMFINLDQVYYENWNDEVVESINAVYPFKNKLLRDMNIIPKAPGEILSYKVNNELLICVMIRPINLNHSFYECLEKAYNEMKSQMTGYRYLALQNNQIKGWISQHFSQSITLLQLIFNDSEGEIWICGVKDTNDKYKFKKNVNVAIKTIKNSHNKSMYIKRTPEKNNFD